MEYGNLLTLIFLLVSVVGFIILIFVNIKYKNKGTWKSGQDALDVPNDKDASRKKRKKVSSKDLPPASKN